MIKANIFDIKRFGIQDGAGIRTVVFLKGCPLRCKWCQNPEGFSKEIRIWARGKQCIGCDSCIQSCPNQAIHRDPKGLVINPAQCDLCGKCEAICPTMTLQRDGRPMDVAETMARILDDRMFYGTEGGVTLSGGECTASPEFSLALLEACRQAGLHTAIETCMHAPPSIMDAFSQAADAIIGDIKILDPRRHKGATGVDNSLILHNFERLARRASSLLIRIPLIPGYTADTENVTAIAAYVAKVNRAVPLELINFNPLCISKYETLRQDYIPTDGKPLPPAEMARFAEIVKAQGLYVKY